MKLDNKPFAAESGHWYQKDGTPAYTVQGKTGERPTTLRDARKFNLVPSVTTILRCAANEGLNRWIKSNLLMAAATLPRLDGESADDWIKRVEEDAKKQSQEAMSLGTSIHASLEKAYRGEDWQGEHDMYVLPVMKAIEEKFPNQDWKAERSFATDRFGGKIDLSSDSVVIDFKTSAKVEEKKESELGYDEHVMQLAAYAEGLGLYDECRLANVYVSTTQPGYVVIKEWTEDEKDRGWDMFFHLLYFWRAKNKV